MTSQIRSPTQVEHLIKPCNILALILFSEFMKNYSLTDSFYYDIITVLNGGLRTFDGHLVYKSFEGRGYTAMHRGSAGRLFQASNRVKLHRCGDVIQSVLFTLQGGWLGFHLVDVKIPGRFPCQYYYYYYYHHHHHLHHHLLRQKAAHTWCS